MEDKLAAIQMAENPEQRCACVLLIDTSGSMTGEPISELNNGLKAFKEALLDDDNARVRVDVAVITFDSEIKLVHDFTTPDEFRPPTLTAQWQTFMGTGILDALERIKERKRQYKDNGIPYYRPWLFIITDGHSQGEELSILEEAKETLKRAKDNKAVHVFAVGVGNQVDLNVIGGITGTKALRLEGLKFKELFEWLSESLQGVAASQPDDQIKIPMPDWTSLEA